MPPAVYVLNNGGKFIEHYHGIEDIPAEHRVFSYPKLSIREQMAAYKEIIDGSSLEGYRKLSIRSVRNDRRHFETFCPEVAAGKEAV